MALNFVRLTITVPPTWSAIAVGSLTRRDISPDSATFVWEFDQPLHEIGWICAGKFWTEQVPGARVPLSLNLFPQDSSSAGGILQLSDDVLDFYSNRFSPYRFPKLSIIEIDDGVAGRNVLAISGPSFVMVKRLAFSTADAFNRATTILPHEIAHQWWPMTVFCDDRDAAFLSEGMCEYSDRLYREAKGSLTLRDSLDRHPLLRPLILRIQKGRDIPLQGRVDLRAATTQYLKAAYVHQMLRGLLGDPAFYLLYHMYAQRYAMKLTGLKDFEALAEGISGKDLRWFFEQWVEKSGAPRLRLYNVKRQRHAAGWITHGRVRLVGYDKFTTKIPVAVTTDSGMVMEDLWIGNDSTGIYHNDVPFEIETAREPLGAILDPEGQILKLRRMPPRFGDLREPADGTMIVCSPDTGEAILHVACKDSASLENAGWSITIKMDTEVTLRDLQQERVFLYGKSSRSAIVAEAQARFPLKVRNDSIVVNGETLGDSALSLMQVIENPYLSQGLLCWIAPLTSKARPELIPSDCSWMLANGADVVTSGTWEVRDEDQMVQFIK